MSISVSTIMYGPYHLDAVWPLLETEGSGQIGIEVFPYYHLTYFEQVLEQNFQRLKGCPISVHCPYFSTDPCFSPGTMEYYLNMDYYKKAFACAQLLNAKYMVHHFYNFHFAVEEREKKRDTAMENLVRFKSLAKEYGVTLALENTEITRNPAENMFTQEEFIRLVLEQTDCKALIDIGHANCAGWDLPGLIRTLKDRIVGYHVHNNDGFHDSHRRILDGTLDIEQFMRSARQYTPNADYTIEYVADFNSVESVCKDIAFLKKGGLAEVAHSCQV